MGRRIVRGVLYGISGVVLLFTVLLLLLLLILVLDPFVFRLNTRGALTEKAVEEELQRDLPVGASYDQIDQYLTARSIEHSYIERSFFKEEEQTVVALIRNVTHGTITTKHIQIRIKLDEEKRLTRITVGAIYSGL